jgi:hypothetical protein
MAKDKESSAVTVSAFDVPHSKICAAQQRGHLVHIARQATDSVIGFRYLLDLLVFEIISLSWIGFGGKT